MVKVHIGGSATAKEAIFVCRKVEQTHPSGVFYGGNPLDYTFTLVILEVIFIIIVTRTVRYLLRPLKQPRIVAEIIGGIIIGPSFLGRNEKFAKYLFSDNASYVLKNIGLMGFVYFLFLSGVKMDLSTLRKPSKKQLLIATLSVAVPFTSSTLLASALRGFMDKQLAKFSIIGGVSSAFAITTFSVLYPIIRELNLLSSEVGRMALSTVLFSDVVGIICIVSFEATRLGENRSIDALWYLLSLAAMVMVIGGIRQAMIWVIKTTPEGRLVAQGYVVAILISVMLVGFLSDISGVAIANGPLWLGLAVSTEPPLAATLVERTETVVLEMFMPFSFAFMGMYVDVFSMSGRWGSLMPLFCMALVAYVTKVVTVFTVSRFFEMSVRDGLALSLIMSFRGQVEVLIFIHWLDLQIIQQPAYTMMVLLSTMVTAIATPLTSILYDPTRPYIVNTRRAIQYTPPNTELPIVACIRDQDSVAGFINLLEISNPTASSPFFVYALRLMEPVGRATAVLIDHRNQTQSPASKHTGSNPIHNALMLFQESRGDDFIKFHPFTSISPTRTMYQDICELALLKKAILIILPFQMKHLVDRSELVYSGGVQAMNQQVLTNAPCSVGILVDKGPFHRPTRLVNHSLRRASHHFAVLFLGGADAREALAYADRMAGNPEVSLTVVRFLSHNGEGDDKMEKKLDDGVVTWFWVKNEGNERVVYREVVVKNGDETVIAIRAMNNDYYDLWIVGRKNGINPVLVQGLSNWSENHELGVIGDFVASMDLGSRASVLVVQQQVLRRDETVSDGLLRIFSCCEYSSK
ncbi:hypothetical protein NMG60_11014442 [Bertholletia excelsa]